MNQTHDLPKSLDSNDPRQLVEEHQQFERRLEELNSKTWLTPTEELEEKRIKKMKLMLKDRIQRIRSQQVG